ncbi:LysR family transcriptional regulator [Actinomadura rayongensis]|nr:LysR family transcriptional regulator [Actinomadura rayongensis]
MELRHLRSFLAVMGERNFTRAARSLHLTQPALSQHIRALEREVGGPLFVRDSRRVVPTAAGEALEQPAREVLRSAARALDLARAAAGGEQGTLRVGLFAGGAAELTAPILEAFAARHPAVRIALADLPPHRAEPAVRSGRVDVALLRLPVDLEFLRATTLFEEPRVLAVARRHRFADDGEITIPSYLDLPAPTIPEEMPRHFQNFWLMNDHRNGEPARFLGERLETVNEALHFALTAPDGCLSVAASIQRTLNIGGLVYLPIVGAEPCAVAVVSRRDDDADLITDFHRTARAVSTELIDLVPYASLPSQRTS